MAPWSGGKAKLATPVPTANNLSMQTLAFMAVVTTWLVALTYHTYSVNTQTFATTPAHLARETSGGFAGSSFRASSPHVFFGPNVTYLEGLATCESFKCVREAHDLPRALPGSPGESAGTRFNWPHFFIAGYSKSATTSLYMYLNKHPQTSAPVTKEPATWTNRCEYVGDKIVCPHLQQRDYLVHIMKRDKFVENGGSLAQFEATPRTFDMGAELADALYNSMPWLKLVASLREPISRAISKYHMFSTKFGQGCLVNSTLADCLKYDHERFYGFPRKKYYHEALNYWVDTFPREQLMLIQYEDLIDGERQPEVLRSLKEFLGLDPTLTGDSLSWGIDGIDDDDAPSSSGNVNCRHCDAPGWPLPEQLYRNLIEKVRHDTLELIYTIDRFQLGNGTRWLENWERIWADNLQRCVDGMCDVRLS